MNCADCDRKYDIDDVCADCDKCISDCCECLNCDSMSEFERKWEIGFERSDYLRGDRA